MGASLARGGFDVEQSGHGTVTIGSVEKYITDTAWTEGWVGTIKPVRERKQSAGIIGAEVTAAIDGEGQVIRSYEKNGQNFSAIVIHEYRFQ